MGIKYMPRRTRRAASGALRSMPTHDPHDNVDYNVALDALFSNNNARFTERISTPETSDESRPRLSQTLHKRKRKEARGQPAEILEEKQMLSGIPAASDLPEQESIISDWRYDTASGKFVDIVGKNDLQPSGNIESIETPFGTIAPILESTDANSFSISDANQSGLDVQDWSFSTWIVLKSLPSDRDTAFNLLTKAHRDNYQRQWQSQFLRNNSFRVAYSHGGNSGAEHSTMAETVDPFLTPEDIGKPIHIAYTVDVSTKNIEIYKNGQPVSVNTRFTSSSQVKNGNADVILGFGNDVDGHLDGQIINPIVWNTPLTAANVDQIFSAYENAEGNGSSSDSSSDNNNDSESQESPNSNTLSPEIDPNAAYFRTLETNDRTVKIAINSPADSSVLYSSYSGQITINHRGGAENLEYEHTLPAGNTNLYAVVLKSNNQTFVDQYYWDGSNLHAVSNETWNLRSDANANAWNDSVERITLEGNVPSGVDVQNPAMQLRLVNNQIFMDIVTGEDQTLVHMLHHPLPHAGRTISQYVLEHPGGFVGITELPIQHPSVNQADSGSRLVYMIKTEGNGVVQDLSFVHYDKKAGQFTKVYHEIPFSLPEVPQRGSSATDNDFDQVGPTQQNVELRRIQEAIQVLGANMPTVSGATPEQILGAYNTKVATIDQRLESLANYQSILDSMLRAVTTTEERDVFTAELEKCKAIASMLQRERIPYSRSHVGVYEVNANEAKIRIRVRSPLTKLKIEVDGESPRYLENPSGIADTTINMELHRNPNRPSGPVRVALVNTENNAVLDEVFVSYDQYAQRASVMTEQPAWDSLETGRLLDTPIEPTIGVMDIHGNNVLVYYATPYDQSRIIIGTGGMLASLRHQEAGGNNTGFAYLSINTDKPTGDYKIFLHARDGGQEIAFVTVHWDKASQQLSLPTGQQLWTAEDIVSDERIQQVVDNINPNATAAERARVSLVTEAEMLLDYEEISIFQEKFNILRSVFTTDRAVAHIQASKLYQRSDFMVPASEFEPIVDAYIQASIPDRVGNHHMRSDLVSDFTQLMSSYESIVGELLVSAIDVYVLQRAGSPEPVQRQRFSDHWDSLAYTRYMNELRTFGVGFPSKGQFLSEGRKLYSEEIDYLLHVQSEDERLLAKEAQLSADRGYQRARGVPDLMVLDRELATAEDGYETGYLTEGQLRRLARAKRLAQYAAEELTGSNVAVRFDTSLDPNDARVGYLQDGGIEIAAHPAYLDETALSVDKAIVAEANRSPLTAGSMATASFTSKTNSLMVDTWVAGINTQEKHTSLLASSTAEVSNGTNAITDWTATVGENFETSWNFFLAEAGDHVFHTNGLEDWSIQNAEVVIDGRTVLPLTRTVSGFGIAKPFPLLAGGHSIAIRGLKAPQDAGASSAHFSLVNVNDLLPSRAIEVDSVFVADFSEVHANKTFIVLAGPEGQSQFFNGAQELVTAFAPILYYNKGEMYDMPMAVDKFPIGINGGSGREMNLGEFEVDDISSAVPYSKRDGIQPAAYSSVTGSLEESEIAINYYFFYLRSNWGEQGGQNTHEGDWEGVTVFLAQQSDGSYVPDRIAVAQHIKFLGNPIGHHLADGGEVVDWVLLSKNGLQPKLYVGLGGHATYTYWGQTEWPMGNVERHWGDGTELNTSGLVEYVPRLGEDVTPMWIKYQGYWGDADLDDDRSWLDGDSAPRGPAFSTNGFDMGEWWVNPWRWSQQFDKKA